MTISEQGPYGTQRKYDAFGGKKKQQKKPATFKNGKVSSMIILFKAW